MDDALKLGELLKLPNLEQDTITLINAKMREFIGDVKLLSPAEMASQKDYMKAFMEEYIHGAKESG